MQHFYCRHSIGGRGALRFCNIMENDAGFVLDCHAHDFAHLNFITQGSVEVKTEQETFTVCKGQAFFMPENVRHSLFSAEGYRQFGVDLICAEDPLWQDSKSPLLFSPDFPFSYEQVYTVMLSEYESDRRMRENISEYLLLACSVRRPAEFVEKFRNAVFGMNAPTVTTLSRVLGYSKTQLERLCRKHFGCSVAAYGDEYRLRTLKGLLESTDMPLSVLAERMEFTDASHLCVFFKKRTGITPAKYRKLYRK